MEFDSREMRATTTSIQKGKGGKLNDRASFKRKGSKLLASSDAQKLIIRFVCNCPPSLLHKSANNFWSVFANSSECQKLKSQVSMYDLLPFSKIDGLCSMFHQMNFISRFLRDSTYQKCVKKLNYHFQSDRLVGNIQYVVCTRLSKKPEKSDIRPELFGYSESWI